jgi:hypothetical protein
VILVLALAGLAGAATKPTLKVTPSTVKPGGKVTFTGAHWGRHTSVTLLLGKRGLPVGKASTLAGVRTTGTGTFSYARPIKSSAPAGRYVIFACRNGCTVKASQPLTIVAGR